MPGPSGYFGVYTATVLNNADPEQRGRLILQVPSVLGPRQSLWAAPIQAAGFPVVSPAPGTPVWVMFEAGNTDSPVWAGIQTKVGSDVSDDVQLDKLTVGQLTVTGTSTFNGLASFNQATLSSTQPLTFTSLGSGVYTKTVVYHDTANGFYFDVARLTDTIAGTPLDFVVAPRGGGNTFRYQTSTGNVSFPGSLSAGSNVFSPLFGYFYNGTTFSTRVGEIFGSAGLYTTTTMGFDAAGNNFRWSSNNVTRMTLTGGGNLSTAGAITSEKATFPSSGYTSGAPLNVGDTAVNYPGAQPGWAGNWTSNILLSGLDQTSISFHDAGSRVDTLRVEGAQFKIGIDAGWGVASTRIYGQLTADAGVTVGNGLDVTAGPNLKAVIARTTRANDAPVYLRPGGDNTNNGAAVGIEAFGYAGVADMRFQIENYSGNWQWQMGSAAGFVNKMTLSAAGGLNTSGTISENGVRVYSPTNPQPAPNVRALIFQSMGA